MFFYELGLPENVNTLKGTIYQRFCKHLCSQLERSKAGNTLNHWKYSAHTQDFSMRTKTKAISTKKFHFS